ncbi:MAG: glycine cleavage system protein R [Anaerolineales bacterium]|jgi:glycine cleavage system transcriptional repressor
MSENQQQYVISIMCRDRVGLIYEISKAISELKGNIADVRQSVLCGYFTMILLASFPQNVSQRAIERKFAEVDSKSETVIDAAVEKVEDNALASSSARPENAYVLTATGNDRIGLVATVAHFCVKNNINILDLSTTVSDGAYIMILLIDLDDLRSIGQVRAELQQYAKENDLKVVMQHHHIFKAVNEINLPIL